jgi:hypothetical protein
VTQQLQDRGYTVVDRGQNPNVPYVAADLHGWSSRIDGGRTLLAMANGALYFMEPFQVVTGKDEKKKATVTHTVWATKTFRTCDGLATDDHPDSLKSGIVDCMRNYIR